MVVVAMVVVLVMLRMMRTKLHSSAEHLLGDGRPKSMRLIAGQKELCCIRMRNEPRQHLVANAPQIP